MLQNCVYEEILRGRLWLYVWY